MDTLSLALGAALGIVAGALGTFALVYARLSGSAERVRAELAEKTAELKTRLDERSQRAAELERQLAGSVDRSQELNAANAALAAQLQSERHAAAEKLAVLAAAERNLREAFQSLSAQALRDNNQTFLELAKTQLGEFQKSAIADIDSRSRTFEETLKPVRESLARVDLKIGEVEKERTGAYSTLTEQVRSLAATQHRLENETANLVKALRAPTVRGRWGELQLRRVVELAGMLEHCDFVEQLTAGNEDAARMRPDMIVKLPGAKNVIIDAKAPLGAYLEALEAEDAATREARMRDHARQVRTHITQLAGKSYWEQFQPNPEFVVMFLPGETFFSAALEHDPGLIEFAIEQRIVLASPTTLIALLRAVAYGWKQDNLAENARAISDLGKELYTRLQSMVGHFDDVGRNLNRAMAAFNKTAGSFESRVLVSARRFEQLSVSEGELAMPQMIEVSTRPMQAVAAQAPLELIPVPIKRSAS